MANKIQIKRGLKTSLPTLNVGEPALCTDTEEFYIGKGSKNIKIINENDFQEIVQARKGESNLKTKIDKLDTNISNINNTITSLNSQIKRYNDYRYISTTFNNDDMKLVVMYSMDGINWDIENKAGSFTPNTGNKTLRDPSIIKVQDYFYITYTKIDWKTGNNIGFCRTKEFKTFEELPDLTFSGFTKIWAPEFFRDYKTNNSYVIINASTDGTTFKPYIQRINFTSSGVVKVDSHIQLTGAELTNLSAIDASIFQDNNRYYLIVKDEVNKTNSIFESFSLTSNYKIIKSGLFLNHEGCQIIKLENSGFRIYMDNYNDRGIGLGFVDTYDWFNSFTQFKEIITEDFVSAHNFVYDLKQVSKTTQYDKSFIIGKRNSDFSIPNSTDTLIQFDTTVKNADFQFSTDGVKAQVGSNGLYLVSANITWDSNGTETERVLEIVYNKAGNSQLINCGKSQLKNMPNVYFAQNVTTMIYCDTGDEIGVKAFQNSGGALNLKSVDYAPMVKIVKLV